ncbi:MAG TPA: protein kinase [Ilumatobacter sp.]
MAEPAIAGYHSFARIGRGGLGDVYRAVESATGVTVAIKVLRDVSDSSLAWHRTRRELTALMALSGHPHVIGPIELIDHADGPALVMEYAEGGSVADLLRDRDGKPQSCLTVQETVFVARQTAAALVAAHQRGIVHRDVKPQNLLIDGRGQIKLCDFGIAALTHDEDYRTRTNAVSTRYASPEDLEHDDPVGPASDMYSLGATMLHLARGAPPTLRDRLAPWEPPETDDVDLAALDALIARCLNPDPAARPAATDLLQGLYELDPFDPAERVTALAFPIWPRVDEPLIRFDDATTVHPTAQPAEPEVAMLVTRPKIDVAPRRKIAVVGVAVGALVFLVGAVMGVRALGDSDHARPVAAPRPATLPTLVDADWTAGRVGDCLVQPPATTALEVVACDEPHDLQRFATGTVSGDVADADERCAAAFEQFVGQAPNDSELDIAQTRPSAQSWHQGDRQFQCYLGIEGKRLTGDAHATGW